ncbi:ATG8-interacting protein 1 [Cocos nucifera]|uniref:ATG8-interacting protein 1 n=1 Tax=Cocos nucifera TaxID=13894 RepID=A0A8K0IKL8_COCNU|nr:ATG8-interacting protein 1 [Cocos nucifera]
MADNAKEGEENLPNGTDWEVVSLTASTYAAAPGPKPFEPTDEGINKDLNKNEQGFPDIMFMSRHFIFPPGKTENLPVEPDYIEIHNKFKGQDASLVEEDDDGPKNTHEESCMSKSDDSLHGIQFFDNGKSLSVDDMEFGEGKGLQRLSLHGEESAIFNAYHAESDINSSILCSENNEIAKHDDPACQNSDSPSDFINASELNEENKKDASRLPCEAWWKRKAVLLYNHAKEGNAFWSVFVAAALMGLAILGQRWQREKLQIQQLKLQFRTNNEGISWTVGPISQFKGILIGEHQRNPLMCGDAVFNH